MDRNKIQADKYIDEVKSLPPAPTTTIELLGLLDDPNSHLDRFVELIRHDPALTAKILKRVNSAHFSLGEPTMDIFEVITRLGFYEVYCVVAAATGASIMALGKAKDRLDINLFWRHSVVTAVAAEKLARRVQEPAAVAFTAGLLHDIGKLIFAAANDTRYADLIKAADVAGGDLSAMEQMAFGVNHAAIGARLLRRWGLPESILLAVGQHHGALNAAQPSAQLVAIIQLANAIAHHLSEPAPALRDWSSSQPEAMTLLKLANPDVPALIAEIAMGLQRVQGFSTQQFDPVI